MKSLVAGAALVGTLGLAAGTGPASAALPATAGAPLTAVVVQTTGDREAAARAVRQLGGEVVRDLPIVDGLSARLPQSALGRLARTPGVRAVTPDVAVTVSATSGGTSGSDLKSVYGDEVGATALRAGGLTGKGVRVALVDTGVTETADLRGRLVPVSAEPTRSAVTDRGTAACVNFSGEEGCQDSFGHGTFLAGLIAGDGTASQGRFTGIAPGAEIVSIKIAGRTGAADVTKVLAAIEWVVSFKDTYGIEVLNLSLGTPSKAPTWVDPLNHAVQRAWKAGITVVVAASNLGPAPDTVTKPGDDPYVITVGSVDDRETPALSDDRSPAFSGRGVLSATRAVGKPDVVAPGVRLVSLRSPGSFIEEKSSGAGVDAVYRRGSGTSMSTAVVSGLVALLEQGRPGLTPDTTKAVLKATAAKVNDSTALTVGAGLVQGQAALTSAATLTQAHRLSDNTSSLDLSRAGVIVTSCLKADCVEQRTGDTTDQGRSYVYGSWDQPGDDLAASLYGNSWYGSQWVSTSGNSWYGNSWYGNSWYGNSWYGVDSTDTSEQPYGAPIDGSAFYGVYQ